MREKTCCFTGHRIIAKKDISVIQKLAKAVILELVEQGVEYFCVGGALGFDTLAAQLLMQLRDEERISIKIRLICPFPEFTSRWTSRQKEVFQEMLPGYDSVLYAEQSESSEAYLKRNRQLVDSSRYCIAYCIRDYGGTAYTIRCAREQRITVLMI